MKLYSGYLKHIIKNSVQKFLRHFDSVKKNVAAWTEISAWTLKQIGTYQLFFMNFKKILDSVQNSNAENHFSNLYTTVAQHR